LVDIESFGQVGFLNIDEGEKDDDIIALFLKALQQTGADLTLSFRNLSRLSIHSNEEERKLLLEKLVACSCSVPRLVRMFRPTIPPRQLEMFITLANENPELLQMMGYTPESLQVEVANWSKFDELRKLTPEEKQEKDRSIW
jgi:uncharacterized protein YdiU (UPF0061 family)